MLPYTLTDTSLTVVIDCVPYVIPSSHPNFAQVIELIGQDADGETIRPLIDLPKAIESFMQGNVEIRDRVVYYKGTECHNYLAQHILRFMEAQDPALVTPLVAFLDNVMENPSYRAAQGLFEWVQKSNLPITTDGYLLAWKIVGPDYRDLHSGRFDNSIGQIVEQPRNLCDEDPDRTCSAGLHFCSYEYLPHYGNGQRDKIVVVKIHPRDVVAFPRDYNSAKGRACRYEVVGEVPFEKVREYFPEKTYVYDGFDAPASDTTWDFAIGQIWVDGDGDEHTITSIDDDNIHTCDDDGDRWILDLEGNYRDMFSLERMILEEPEAEAITIEVGQRWKTREGGFAVITNANQDDGHYPIVGDVEENGEPVPYRTTWTVEGRYYTAGEDGRDLVELLRDV